MTPSELSAIRARLDAASRITLRTSLFGPLKDDARALLDEVERLTTLLAGTETVLENEREYQARLKAEVGQLANESFRRGAEAMRESLAMAVIGPMAPAIRALPLPEDK